MGAVFWAGLGGAADYVRVSDPWGQGKNPLRPCLCGSVVCPRHIGTWTPVGAPTEPSAFSRLIISENTKLLNCRFINPKS